MSTPIPLTLIEGSMALPSLSPLSRLLPAPFGRGWALLPPGHSLRAELKALYAAVLRTFCLDAQTIRGLCQWESLRKPPPASSGFIRPAASTTVFHPPVDESLQASAETASFSPARAPATPASPRDGSMHWGAVAGSACALGGAAMLAWIAFGHFAQHHTPGDVEPAGRFPLRHEAQSAKRPSPDASVNPHSTATSDAAELAPSGASSSVHVVGVSGPVLPEILPSDPAAVPPRDLTANPVTEIATPVKAVPVSATASKNVSRHPDKQITATARPRERTGHRSRTSIAAQLPSMPPMTSEAPQIAVPAVTQQTSPKPSSAGAYSPRASSPLGADEYTSTTMSAGTHLRHVAPPSRPAASVNQPGSGDTEWVDHLSQRRVTDIPNQFVK